MDVNEFNKYLPNVIKEIILFMDGDIKNLPINDFTPNPTTKVFTLDSKFHSIFSIGSSENSVEVEEVSHINVINEYLERIKKIEIEKPPKWASHICHYKSGLLVARGIVTAGGSVKSEELEEIIGFEENKEKQTVIYNRGIFVDKFISETDEVAELKKRIEELEKIIQDQEIKCSDKVPLSSLLNIKLEPSIDPANVLITWIEQTSQCGEEYDSIVYIKNGKYHPALVKSSPLGSIVMPRRLAQVLCMNLNEGNWEIK